MTEVVVDKISNSILHIKVLISLGHRMALRDMSNHMDAISHLTGLVYQDESIIVHLRPLRGNAMQIPTFGNEMTAYGIGRDDNFCLSIVLQEVS